jgi:L-serine kinase (ADP)
MNSIHLFNNSIIKSFKYISPDKIYPHEKVIYERKNSLKKYLLSYKEYCIIPSIICCSQTNMIIDGHHRFNTLKELGVKNIPVIFIDYNDISIRTHNEKSLQLSKKNLIENSLKNKLYDPKSTIHEVKTIDGIWKPIILLSNLAEIYL